MREAVGYTVRDDAGPASDLNGLVVQNGWAVEKDSFLKLSKHTSTGCREAAPVLLDLYLAAQADGFLGLFTSNVDRCATPEFQTLVARLGSEWGDVQESGELH